MNVFTMRKGIAETKFQALASSDVLTLRLYDIIGADLFGDGITAKGIADALATSGQFSSITLRINSPGGDLFEGVTIYNLLKSQNKPINVMVDGLAASAASLIAMAGDTCVMGDGACMMIHRAMGIAVGCSDEMLKTASVLDTVTDSASDIYVARTGMKKKKVMELMTAETWMTSQEAVDKGFATSTSPQKVKNIANRFDLSVFKNTPDSLKDGAACECECVECQDGNCDDCSHDPCDCVGCTCEQHTMIAEPTAEADDYLINILRKRLEMLKRTA
jgi:ATP-dependent protease ClpP protease subunit